MSQYFKPQINTALDKSNVAFYGVANLALCVGVERLLNAPNLMATAFITSSALCYFSLSGHAEIIRRNFAQTVASELPEGSEELPEMVQEISEALSISPTPALHVLKRRKFADDTDEPSAISPDAVHAETGEKIERDRFEIKLVEAYKKYTNGMTYGTRRSGLMFSGDLMSVLSRRNQVFLVAHELGHQAARHLEKSIVPTILVNTAALSGTMNFAVTVFSSWSGWVAPALGFVALAKSGLLVDKLIPRPLNEEKVQAARFLVGAIGAGTILGVAYVSHNPAVARAWVAVQAINLTAKALNASMSRSHEYQADRLAAEVMGDGKLAAQSLKRICHWDAVLMGEAIETDPADGDVVRRGFKRAKDLFRSHPSLARRVRRLNKLAGSCEQTRVDPI